MLPSIREEDGHDRGLGWTDDRGLWKKVRGYESSIAASEWEEAGPKCALVRANTTEEEKELAASALRKARAKTDDLEREIQNWYDLIPSDSVFCRSVSSLLTRMRENKARRCSKIEPF